MTKRIGLFGGTLDPVHLQHIAIAKTAYKTLKLDTLYFIPNKTPSYRPEPQTSAEQRLTMLEIALQHYPEFKVDHCELQREGYSYSIDTLKLYRKRYPDTELFFLIGSDQLIDLPNWDGYAEFKSLCHFAVAERPGFLFPKNILFSAVTVPSEKKTGLFFKLPIIVNPISATEIRTRLLQNDTTVYPELDAGVLKYILKNALYT